jgi:hypothetical protein
VIKSLLSKGKSTKGSKQKRLGWSAPLSKVVEVFPVDEELCARWNLYALLTERPATPDKTETTLVVGERLEKLFTMVEIARFDDFENIVLCLGRF